MHELAHEFTKRKISPWGGIKFFQQTYERSGIREVLERLPIPKGLSNRSYEALTVIEGFMVSVVLGARRLAHSGLLRNDQVIQEIFGWEKGMASSSTFSRFFARFGMETNNAVFPSLMKSWWSKIKTQKLTIDIDSTVITRYGQQEFASRGYNPTKRGRKSHHPLLAFCDELKMVVNAWMRSGDSHSSTDIDGFLDELFYVLPKKRIGLIRGDSGFYSKDIMLKLEESPSPINYIIRAKLTTKLLGHIYQCDDWYSNDSVMKGAEYTEIQYLASGWLIPRRMVIVRTLKKDKENQPSEGSLFPQISEYDYRVYVTNTSLSAYQVHALYNQRAECENRIKELKYDYGIDGFALKSFWGMEAAFRFIILAYNLMALFKQKVMTGPVKHRLSTIRFQCIAIGSYLVKDGRKTKMKLAAEGKRRHFLEYFFTQTEKLKPPFEFSIA